MNAILYIREDIRLKWFQWRWFVWQGRIIDKHGLDCEVEREHRERIMEQIDAIAIARSDRRAAKGGATC